MLSTQTAQQSLGMTWISIKTPAPHSIEHPSLSVLVSLGVLFGQTIKAAASASRVFEFIHLQPNVPLKGGVCPETVLGNVQFRNVGFSYPSRPEHRVLDNFSLDVPQGTTVALCGPSGKRVY